MVVSRVGVSEMVNGKSVSVDVSIGDIVYDEVDSVDMVFEVVVDLVDVIEPDKNVIVVIVTSDVAALELESDTDTVVVCTLP